MTRGVQKSSQVNATRHREIPYANDGESQYAWVTKMLGNNRVTVRTMDFVERLGVIRGSMRKREWMAIGDLVLISTRDFQLEKVDVIFKYTDTESRQMMRYDKTITPFHQAHKGSANATQSDHEVVFEGDEVDMHAI